MAYGFTCLKCGQPLTQDTVVFDLLNDDQKRGKKDLTLWLTGKELRSIWRKKGKTGRYVVKLTWKDFLRYAGNERNLGNGLLENLQFSNSLEVLEKQCKSLVVNYSDVMRGLNKAFLSNNTGERKKAPIFYREVVPSYEDGVLTRLRVFGNGCKPDGNETARRCCRKECRSEQPDWAGSHAHRTVVLLGAETKSDADQTIREEVEEYLRQYRWVEKHPAGYWIATQVDGDQIRSTTLLIEGAQKSVYLTLATVPRDNDAYSVTEYFFQEADAYVLCTQVDAVVVDGVKVEAVKNKEWQKDVGGMLDCLKKLQEHRSKRLELTDGCGGHAPVLLICASKTGDSGSDKDIDGKITKLVDGFKKEQIDQEESAACNALIANMGLPEKDSYYFWLRYSTNSNSWSSAETAAAWILWTTGCVPIAMENLLPEEQEKLPSYRVIPPICKQWPPERQMKKRKRKIRMPETITRMCRAEAAARLFLFSNAQENESYIEADSPLELLKLVMTHKEKKGER